MEFFLRMEIRISFLIQGFLSTQSCRREQDFSGACLVVVYDTILIKLLKILVKFAFMNGESPRKNFCRNKFKSLPKNSVSKLNLLR